MLCFTVKTTHVPEIEGTDDGVSRRGSRWGWRCLALTFVRGDIFALSGKIGSGELAWWERCRKHGRRHGMEPNGRVVTG